MSLMEMRGPHNAGGWKITQVVEWEGEAFPYSRLFPNLPQEAIREASPAGAAGRMAENGMIVTSLQFFVLQSSRGVALVEQGSGNGKTRPADPYWDHQRMPYLETLAALGIRPEDVGAVFLSHLHLDHVGLACTDEGGRWIPTFPNAKFVIQPREWEYWSGRETAEPGQHPHIADSIRPVVDAGLVQWTRDGQQIGGVRIHEAPGHTPGNLLFELDGADTWFLGDLLHHPSQIRHPEWPSADFDWDADRNGEVRRRFYHKFAATRALLFGVHMGNPFRILPAPDGGYSFRAV